MHTGNNKTHYRGWLFRDDVPLIPRDYQWMGFLEEKIDGIGVNVDVDIDVDEIKQAVEDTINENLGDKFCKVHHHIEEAKEHLCCDICCARKDIKKHIDNKMDYFDEQFSNLNEQAETIIGLLNH